MGGLRIGRIAGIPVTVSPSVVVIVILLSWGLAVDELPASAPGRSTATYWATAVAVSVLLVASLLVHELSHSIVAHRHAMRVQGISLWVFGGIATLEDEAPDPVADHRVALAGPLASFGLGVAAGAVAVTTDAVGGAEVATAAAWWLALSNVALALFNLLPGAPLDGGRLLRAHLWKRTADRDGAAIRAARAGRVLGVALIGLGLVELVIGLASGGLWMMFIGWFVHSAARIEEADARVRRALRGLRVRDAFAFGVVGARARPERTIDVAPDDALVAVRDRLAIAGVDQARVVDRGIVIGTLTGDDVRRCARAQVAARRSRLPMPPPPPWRGIVSGRR